MRHNRITLTLLTALMFSVVVGFATDGPNDPTSVEITGPASSKVGLTERYYLTFYNSSHLAIVPPTAGSFNWTFPGGTLIEIGPDQTTIDVRWTSKVGNYVSFEWDNSPNGYLDDFLSVTVVAIPTPSNSVSTIFHCGTTDVSYVGSPPADYTLIWTTSGTDPFHQTDFLASTQSVSISQTRNLYLRARTLSSPFIYGTAYSVGSIPVYSTAPIATSDPQLPIWSGNPTSIILRTSNNVSGTTYSWTQTHSSNISGVSNGSGSTIVQSPSNNGIASGIVTYNVTPTAHECVGSVYSITVSVEPSPIVEATSSRLAINNPVVLTAKAEYVTYDWRNRFNQSKGNTRAVIVSDTGIYKVIVTKIGIEGSGSSSFYSIKSQMDGVDMNYIISNSILVQGVVDSASVKTLPVDSLSQSIAYFDGLGRGLQTVVTQGSPSKHDIVSPVSYDPFGREQFKYLPFVNGADGIYKDAFIPKESAEYSTSSNPQFQFYQGTTTVPIDTAPYSKTVFEESPLSRPLKDFGPGQAWTSNNKRIDHGYPVNIHGTGSRQEKIIIWNVNSTTGALEQNTAINNGFYQTASLSIKSTTDEHGNEVREYTDKLGRVILKKVFAYGNPADFITVGNWAETYYVYDDLGNLTFVLPPEAVRRILNPNGN